MTEAHRSDPRVSAEDALRAFASGGMVLLVDERDGQGSGAVACAAEAATADVVNFMATHARGLVCLALSRERAEALGLGLLPRTSPDVPAYTVSIEAATGVTTGISAADRARTVEVAIDPASGPDDLVSPGHLFPVVCHPGGVLVLQAPAEAALDLARLAGCRTAAALYTTVLAPGGDVAGVEDLDLLAATHGLPIVTLGELTRFRMGRETVVREIESGTVPTRYGEFDVSVWENLLDGEHHVLLRSGATVPEGDAPAPLVRIHSQCLTGDVFHSHRCDCGGQLEAALAQVQAEGSGAVLYLRQEGRGIGLVFKLQAYELQDRGRDTVEANEELGFKADPRDYGVGAQILLAAGYRRMRLLTNNPRKVSGIQAFGLVVEGRVALVTPPHPENLRYLRAKRDKLGHLLENI